MSRTCRQVAVGYPHHITQRGNNRQQVFFDDQDRITYLTLLLRYSVKYQLKVWSYCLMPNHTHLLVVPTDDLGLSRGVGIATMVYTQYINRKYLRTGRLWQGRFSSSAVMKDSYLWAVARYIANNPVVAGLVDCAEDYEWSSAKHHILDQSDPYVTDSCWLFREEKQSFKEFLGKYDKQTDEMISQAISSSQPIC